MTVTIYSPTGCEGIHFPFRCLRRQLVTTKFKTHSIFDRYNITSGSHSRRRNKALGGANSQFSAVVRAQFGHIDRLKREIHNAERVEPVLVTPTLTSARAADESRPGQIVTAVGAC